MSNFHLDHEECCRELEKMVEVMKGAVAMEIAIEDTVCTVSLYYCNGATRKARLQLYAIAMSSEQNGTRATGDSAWLGIERAAALFDHGTRHDFCFGSRQPCKETFVRKLGLSIAQNANLVKYLRIEADGFFKRFLSLDVWKEAFPSLQDAYLSFKDYMMEVSPHIMKHVRRLTLGSSLYKITVYSDLTSNMIRNKDSVVEEIEFHGDLLYNAKLLDDMLRRVRSFSVKFNDSTAFNVLTRSLERTKQKVTSFSA